jgi:ABC-type multidrug transport system ATPase subunit
MEDSDVQAERARLANAGPRSTRAGEATTLLVTPLLTAPHGQQVTVQGNTRAVSEPIAIVGFRKVFSRKLPVNENGSTKMREVSKVAVHDLTLGVPEGTVLGLLGPNGAGKTTALSMLTGSVSVTSGDAYVDGHSIRNDMMGAFANMGYCPQFDALWDDLSGREHLLVHGAIRGLSDEQAAARATSLISTLNITEHADKITKTYSGGTKRKLSFAISMMALPRCVLLDEPSTGMDPATRRFMWDIIHTTAKGRSVILTTHSMEEAEELCSRIAIMINGRLRCIGTTAHLKNRYALHYMLEMKLPAASQAAGQSFVEGLLPGASLIENYGSRLMWKVPTTLGNGKKVSLADVFRSVEGQRSALAIEEYSFSQATLEQVFLDFAKGQHDE